MIMEKKLFLHSLDEAKRSLEKATKQLRCRLRRLLTWPFQIEDPKNTYLSRCRKNSFYMMCNCRTFPIHVYTLVSIFENFPFAPW